MFIKNKKRLFLVGVLSIGVLMATVTYISANLKPERKPGSLLEAAQASIQPKVTKNTLLRVEYDYLCGNKETSETKAPSDLIGMGMTQLAQKFRADDGWTVSANLPDSFGLKKAEWDVCPKHRSYRHLGIAEGYLAIFEGPLGMDATLLQKEDIKVANLPKELREQLALAAKFIDQAPEAQGKLRENLEFMGDEQINAFLDNLDEYREE